MMATPTREYGWIVATTPEEKKALGPEGEQQHWFHPANEWGECWPSGRCRCDMPRRKKVAPGEGYEIVPPTDQVNSKTMEVTSDGVEWGKLGVQWEDTEVQFILTHNPSIIAFRRPIVKEEAKDALRVSCGDGKYTVVQDAKGRLTALRHGEEWRDCIGDNLVLALAYDLDAARSAEQAAFMAGYSAGFDVGEFFAPAPGGSVEDLERHQEQRKQDAWKEFKEKGGQQ